MKNLSWKETEYKKVMLIDAMSNKKYGKGWGYDFNRRIRRCRLRADNQRKHIALYGRSQNQYT